MATAIGITATRALAMLVADPRFQVLLEEHLQAADREVANEDTGRQSDRDIEDDGDHGRGG